MNHALFYSLVRGALGYVPPLVIGESGVSFCGANPPSDVERAAVESAANKAGNPQSQESVAFEHNAAIDEQIAAHEKRELAPRFNREATLVMLAKFYMAEKSVDFATAVSQMTTAGHAGYNAGFAKLKALDDTIRALRAQRQS